MPVVGLMTGSHSTNQLRSRTEQTCCVGQKFTYFQRFVSKHPHCRIRKWMSFRCVATTSTLGPYYYYYYWFDANVYTCSIFGMTRHDTIPETLLRRYIKSREGNPVLIRVSVDINRLEA